MNCPKCGASEIENGTWPFSYECGSGGDRRERIYHSVVCVELCDLRKWREVVLKNVFVDWSDYDPRHWAVDIECDKSIPLLNVGDNPAEAFDAAVRKEMDIAPEAPY